MFTSKSRIPLLIALCAVIVLCAVISLRTHDKFTSQPPRAIQYFRINDELEYSEPSHDLIQPMEDNRVRFNFVKAKRYADANFILFETLNMIDVLMKQIKYPRESVTHIYGLAGSDLLVSKSMLAIVLKESLNRDIVDLLIPKTYVLENPTDLTLLKADNTPNTIYIMKKNIQRQEGYHITDNVSDVMSKQADYVVAQVMLQNPYLVNGRKVNMRVYLLVIVDRKGIPFFFIYNNGFMYYTPELFQANSMDPKKVITTGYVDRELYKVNPLDFGDLQRYMGGASYNVLFGNIINTMRVVKDVYAPIFKANNKNLPGIGFLIYGVDIAPDVQLNVTIMEVNKGPDLTYKDHRDKAVKLSMMTEALEIAGMGPRTSNNFVML